MGVTVKQLREKLAEFPEDAVVLLHDQRSGLEYQYYVNISVGPVLSDVNDLVAIWPTEYHRAQISMAALKQGWRPQERSDA